MGEFPERNDWHDLSHAARILATARFVRNSRKSAPIASHQHEVRNP